VASKGARGKEAHHALREALHDSRLADARIADEHRVVFGAAAEDADAAPDLLVAPDDRVQHSDLGSEIDAVLLQRLQVSATTTAEMMRRGNSQSQLR
jgi:hypothetical protein